jgi:Oligonucleotide/oligosaccharide-binding (OB)-fold
MAPRAGIQQKGEDVVLPEYVVYHELRLTSKQWMATVSEVDAAWLMEVAPQYYKGLSLENASKQKKVKGKGRAGGDVEG